MVNVYDKVGEVAASNQFVSIGDTNHLDVDIHEIFSRNEMMESLASSGVKHVLLETPVEMQAVANMYINQAITRDEFMAIAEMFRRPVAHNDADRDAHAAYLARTLDSAKENGIQVHFVDGDEGTIDPEKLDLHIDNEFPLMMNWLEYVRENPDYFELSQQDRLQKYNEFLGSYVVNHPEYFENYQSYRVYKPDNMTSEEFRLSFDPHVAARIKDLVGEDKAAILYGNAHLNRQSGDIDAELGSTTITFSQTYQSGVVNNGAFAFYIDENIWRNNQTDKIERLGSYGDNLDEEKVFKAGLYEAASSFADQVFPDPASSKGVGETIVDDLEKLLGLKDGPYVGGSQEPKPSNFGLGK